MRKMFKRSPIIIALLICLLMLAIPSQSSYAQWPPFRFNLTPSYQDGKITYTLDFLDQTGGSMRDVVINIPIPEGTSYLEGTAQASTSVTFDGKEVSFVTYMLSQNRIRTASFTVEITDPSRTEFTTHAWISWKGEVSGDFLTDEVSVDTTKEQKPLSWNRPPNSNLFLEMGAKVTDDIVTYTIQAENTRGGSSLRMWDVKINVPIPADTTFLSADATAPFVATFDGREVSFSAIELAVNEEVAPLSFKVSTKDATEPFLVTHAWASWKNSGRGVIRNLVSQDEVQTGDVIVQLNSAQQTESDPVGDVPFASYDLTSVALQRKDNTLEASLFTAGPLCPADAPLQFQLFIDTDCNSGTGRSTAGLGVEYQVVYNVEEGKPKVRAWDAEKENWSRYQTVEGGFPAGSQTVNMLIPYNFSEGGDQLCWTARARYIDNSYELSLPVDNVFGSETLLTNPASSTSAGENVYPANSTRCANDATNLTPSPDLANLSGQIAIPLDNGQVRYDIYIFSLPDGQEIARIPNARQPNFHPDGQRILINREGGGIENLFEYNLADHTERQVSDAPQDAYPFYDLWGNRVVYMNDELSVGSPKPERDENGKIVLDSEGDIVYQDPQRPFIYVQCNLLPPHQESDPRCKNIAFLGVLVPAGQVGEIQGTHPVWTIEDMIAFRGCNTWAGSRQCGIYVVPSTSTKGFSNGFIPRQLTNHTTDAPSDTKGHLIAFTSHRDDNWEAYLVNLNGQGLINLSNSPTSNDGLPTISPDGNWVAFVSDRGGVWAVWAVPVWGGEPQKLFDLPVQVPWGDGDRVWTNERISWGSTQP